MSQLGATLRGHARERGEAPAVFAGDRWWTYDELVDVSDRVGAALGVGLGDVVAVAIDRGIEAVIGVCAALLAGAIPAVLDPRDSGLAARTLQALRPAAVLVGPGDAALPGAQVLAFDDDSGAAPPPRPVLPWGPLERPDTISHIIFTSGSTAAGKGVVWSELRAGYDWLVNPPSAMHRAGPSGVAVPLCTALGLQEVLRSLHHGLAVALLEPPFLSSLAQAAALGVNRWKLTPTHVELWLASATTLPALRAVQVATAPITPERLAALQARAPNARIGRSYGLTESGAATMVWLDKHPRRLHTVGRPIAFRRVTVRDGKGRVLEPGTWGEVVIEMPMWSNVDGYLDAPPELARRFRNGTLWTGDRGTLDRHGFLRLGPRLAEILKVGGRSVSAPRIEETLVASGHYEEVVVVGVPDAILGEVPCAVFVPRGEAWAAAAAAVSSPAAMETAAAARASTGSLAAVRAAATFTPVSMPVVAAPPEREPEEAGEVTGPTSGGATHTGLEPNEWSRTPADELPRWYLARRELPRGPSGKRRRGLLAREAAAWTKRFDASLAAGARVMPAWEPEGGLAIIDGAPLEWTGEPGHEPGLPRLVLGEGGEPVPALDAGARAIALVARRPARPLAYAIVQAGVAAWQRGGIDDAVRFVLGPLVTDAGAAEVTPAIIDAFAAECVQLADLLPGNEAVVTYALPPVDQEDLYATAGFAPVPERAGWWKRRIGTIASTGLLGPDMTAIARLAVPETALDELARSARILERWARRQIRGQ